MAHAIVSVNTSIERERVAAKDLLVRFNLKVIARDKNLSIYGYSQTPSMGKRGWQLTVKGEVVRLDQLFDIQGVVKNWIQSMVHKEFDAYSTQAMEARSLAKVNGSKRANTYIPGLKSNIVFKGQGVQKIRDRFSVSIRTNGKTKFYGKYATREEALTVSEEVYILKNIEIDKNNREITKAYNKEKQDATRKS